MNYIQTVLCAVAVCAMVAGGVFGYEYLTNEPDQLINELGQDNDIGGYTMATSGTCGDNLTWELTQYGSQADEYILTITGTGPMYNYTANSNSHPWYEYRTKIIAVSIGSEVTTIGDYSFSYFTEITSLTIPDSVTSIGTYAFQHCFGLTTLSLGTGVTTIGGNAFYHCYGITSSLIIPDSVTSIGSSAFYGCTGITTLSLGTGVTTIFTETFRHCTGITTLTIPDSVTYIGPGAFNSCTGLTTLSLGTGLTFIGSGVFQGCTGLTSLTIPNSVTTISASAFQGCTGLTSLTIPGSVTSISSYAFKDCTNLTTIYNQSSLLFTKGATTYGYVAYYATTLVQGDATLTLNRASADPVSGTYETLTVAPGTSVTLPAYSFTTTETGTNKVTTLTHTATGWTAQ